jgi:hypothetical protein
MDVHVFNPHSTSFVLPIAKWQSGSRSAYPRQIWEQPCQAVTKAEFRPHNRSVTSAGAYSVDPAARKMADIVDVGNFRYLRRLGQTFLE